MIKYEVQILSNSENFVSLITNELVVGKYHYKVGFKKVLSQQNYQKWEMETADRNIKAGKKGQKYNPIPLPLCEPSGNNIHPVIFVLANK